MKFPDLLSSNGGVLLLRKQKGNKRTRYFEGSQSVDPQLRNLESRNDTSSKANDLSTAPKIQFLYIDS